ncbi:MAG: chromate resistance protein [Sulfuritalea sp.]|nr:chromate resistance protein [Sulfuritalea sp.]
MDTTKPFSDFSSNACSPSEAAVILDTPDAPVLIDVRKNEAFLECNYTLPGALRRDPLQVAAWGSTVPAAASVLVFCVHGHEVSAGTAQALREQGRHARILEGGIEAWREQGLPLLAKAAGHATRWVTRERPKIDRIACPWLLRSFVDDTAEFFYVPVDQVASAAERESAMPYDVTPQVAKTVFTHVGEQCSFDAFIRHYHLQSDAALMRLADIVRGADTSRLDLSPQSAGLLAVSLGMSQMHANDHSMLETMMPVYDALYAWCRDAVAGQDEKHNWTPQAATP